MNLKLYNTISRDLTPVDPVKPGQIGLYACGPTVYDHAHIGHARAAVAFDVLVRYLTAKGLKVNYVRNFTDVDDKIVKRAKEEGRPWLDLAEEHIESFKRDMADLNCLPPTHCPRATEYIPQMLEDIALLIERGRAYEISGDVYFDVGGFPEYGKLSGRDLTGQEAGARISVDARKKNPADFALWKASRPDEPSWPSPFGPGRPGWHTECSAMSFRLLGPVFDIHGGGQDLIFPHHENELAQALALGRPMAKIWVHNGFINVNDEKMSKSLGNVRNVREIVKIYPPETVRYFLVAKHYRSPLDFTEEALMEAWRTLDRVYRTLEATPNVPVDPLKAPKEAISFRERFLAALDDDLNAPKALGAAFELIHALNRVHQEGNAALAASLRRELVDMGRLLGVWNADPAAFLSLPRPSSKAASVSLIEELMDKRAGARSRRDFKEADRLRAELADLGVLVEDKAGQSVWRYV
jgi:cysteinyl-tRNA synthetase